MDDDSRLRRVDARETRRSRRDDRESARVRPPSSTPRERDANETRTRRERDANETHLESRGGVDRVLVETVPRVSGEKEAS